jgi:hypothetical protein
MRHGDEYGYEKDADLKTGGSRYLLLPADERTRL